MTLRYTLKAMVQLTCTIVYHSVLLIANYVLHSFEKDTTVAMERWYTLGRIDIPWLQRHRLLYMRFVHCGGTFQMPTHYGTKYFACLISFTISGSIMCLAMTSSNSFRVFGDMYITHFIAGVCRWLFSVSLYFPISFRRLKSFLGFLVCWYFLSLHAEQCIFAACPLSIRATTVVSGFSAVPKIYSF